MLELQAKHVQFSHVRVFSDSRNVQKRATKSDTSGHCLVETESCQTSFNFLPQGQQLLKIASPLLE